MSISSRVKHGLHNLKRLRGPLFLRPSFRPTFKLTSFTFHCNNFLFCFHYEPKTVFLYLYTQQPKINHLPFGPRSIHILSVSTQLEKDQGSLTTGEKENLLVL